MNGSPIDDDEPPEHRRYAQYLRALESVAEAEEAELLATVLRDEDQSVAEAAVNQHLERRAAAQLTGPGFPAWAGRTAEVIGERAFLVRRLREWTLLRTIALDEPWAEEELLTASDWFQRTVTTSPLVTSPAAFGLLAERGRTRRVRNAASRRG
ncbi:hypothetical protein [Kitasatospora purpeofusca]|uniref:hypothetical protein n=1 Tax=Kitasatospora purpeofusca TaxID=67352 RepID=UPI00224D0A08|nr:hypothetical protein [Kitasatospora purpeofusca]MCX4756972.1 hypothetical protein [Kitasatospora purpeofusca]WSR35260.1 hypothetical protein OG715_32450 [Kitasatospora purpeofusca]WSR43580.1 hypothetical protein OG196_33490 [Kitasatospora purpeofusca]